MRKNCALNDNLLNFHPNFSSRFLLEMKTIYENLDTSFVNLSALVRYLQRREFAGNIRLELAAYEGEIVFTKGNQPKAREHDRLAGRIAEGEEALQRLLIRAREPGGIIHVYQTAAQTDTLTERKDVLTIEQNISDKKVIAAAHLREAAQAAEKPFPARATPLHISGSENENAENVQPSFGEIIAEAKRNAKLPEFPFELSNNVEAKAKRNQLSTEDWETLLRLTTELLRTLDDSLAQANLNFPAAFEKACAEISEDYPFLNPNSDIFIYKNGEIEMRKLVNAKLFVAGINEALRRILTKLSANPKFADARRSTVQNILALVHRCKPLYDKFFITPQLEKILGA